MLPVPLNKEKEYGATPPEPEKVIVELIKVVWDVGDMAKAGLIVTADVAVAPNESVTRIDAVPDDAGAV